MVVIPSCRGSNRNLTPTMLIDLFPNLSTALEIDFHGCLLSTRLTPKLPSIYPFKKRKEKKKKSTYSEHTIRPADAQKISKFTATPRRR